MSEIQNKTAHLTDQEFRSFILLLAEANEQRAQDRKDTITIARSRLASFAPNKRHSNATAARAVRELCAKQAWDIQESDATWTIHIRNWSEFQGFAPTDPRRIPNETPATTTTPTTTTRSPPTPPKNTEVEKLRLLYNEFAEKAGWTLWQAISPERRRQAQARLKQASVEEHRGFLEKCWRNPHLQGENDRNWKADPEWFLTKKALRKFKDGAWDYSSSPTAPSADSAPMYLTPERCKCCSDLMPNGPPCARCKCGKHPGCAPSLKTIARGPTFPPDGRTPPVPTSA